MKRMIALLAAAVLMAAACAGEGVLRDLKVGDSGEDVLRLKQRMYALGYFTSYSNLTENYTRLMGERIRQLQRNNGLEETGIATVALQELIYSDACVWQAPTPVPTATPPALPETAEDGFLPGGSEPFVRADRENGVWIYLSADADIRIFRYSDPSVPRIWFETRIRLRDPAQLRSMLSVSSSGRLGTRFVKPAAIGKTYGAILMFSDDFFGYRREYSQRVGVIIRDGVVYSDSTRPASSKAWPPLDILAVFADGHMQTFESDAHTAAEYLEMGVKDTYAFGPILVRDGAVCGDVWNWSTTDRAPRQAVGFTEDGTVVVLTVLGRRKDAVGTTIQQTAEMMQRTGVREALNLDGGNTVSLVFMGDMINRPVSVRDKDIRSVTGMIGYSE